MARIVTYTMVMAGLWTILALAGLHVGSNQLLAFMGINTSGSISNTAVIAVQAVFALAIAAGIIIVGLFTRQSVESSLIAGTASSMAALTFVDFASIISYMFGVCAAGSDCNFAAWLIFTIFSVLWAGYFVSILQWWRGNDL